ncbi:hypothetical protein ABID08_003347 [Rhizobium binae]|uniref:Uncharacterized protein n=1 Tax=Rhizobium binae TaxID=1138190 RepID=A0ABV2MHM9_9HYPH
MTPGRVSGYLLGLHSANHNPAPGSPILIKVVEKLAILI